MDLTQERPFSNKSFQEGYHLAPVINETVKLHLFVDHSSIEHSQITEGK
ncbi:GH32 C-terminal domain-containing protein [Halobacillus mangrovi]